VLKEQELAERFKQLLLTPGSGNVAETRAFIEEDTRRWTEVIKEANIPKI
jgi:tripartite-type tricarboxylate transporter receptor subunit TctC